MSLVRAATLCSVALAAASAFAGPVKANVKLLSSPVVGKVVKGVLSISIPTGYHVYANPPSSEYQIPLRVTLSGPAVQSPTVKYPVGTDLMIAGDEKPSKVYESKFAIPFSTTLSKVGKTTLSFRIEYQMCDEHACLPPSRVMTVFNVVVKKK
jgi:DsbC/DsbD-like thiol-disulfide interchange protein